MKKLKTLLSERNFALLMTGVFINGLGSGIYLVSGMLLVRELSGSTLYSGFAVFAISSAAALGFLIAPLANYVKIKNGLVYSNLIKAIILMTIPLLYYTIGLNVWYVIVLLFIVALFTQFTYPIESTLIPIIVGKEHVVEANSILQTIRETLDIVFLVVAGIIITFIGTVPALSITAVCLLFVSLCYSFFNFPQPEISTEHLPSIKASADIYFSDLKAGFSYIKNTLIPKMIFMFTFINIAMVIMTTNLPAFSLVKGNGVEAVYGFYLGAISAGMLIGTVLAPKLKQIQFGKLIVFLFTGTGILWLLSATLSVIPSIILFGLGYVSMGIVNILIFSFIQKKVETAFIGRVITLLSSTAALGMPIGSLIGGALGEVFPVQIPLILCGIAMFIFCMIWFGNSVLRKLPNLDNMKLVTNSNE